MSSLEGPVEMESNGTQDVSEGSGSAVETASVSSETAATTTSDSVEIAATTATVSVETCRVPCSQISRALQSPQVSETVVPEASSSSEACSSSQADDDVLYNQSATNAILEELELMRPTYVFSEDTVRAEGSIFDSYLASALDFSSSSESEEDSDSCISPPASRTSMRRSGASGFHPSMFHYRNFMQYMMPRDRRNELRPNTTPNRRRRAPYFELTRDGIAFHTSTGEPTLFRI